MAIRVRVRARLEKKTYLPYLYMLNRIKQYEDVGPKWRRIYKQITISGDHLYKFTGFLSYLKPYDETLIVPSGNVAEDSIILNDAFDEALLKAMKDFFPAAVMQS